MSEDRTLDKLRAATRRIDQLLDVVDELRAERDQLRAVLDVRTAERDRARSTAVTLEQELAQGSSPASPSPMLRELDTIRLERWSS